MLSPLVIPVEQGVRSVIVPQPQPVGGRNTYLVITFITDLPNRTDIRFPFDRATGLVRLEFLANSVPVKQNITVTTGAAGACSSHSSCDWLSSRAIQTVHKVMEPCALCPSWLSQCLGSRTSPSEHVRQLPSISHSRINEMELRCSTQSDCEF